jgi:hypothetical protein
MDECCAQEWYGGAKQANQIKGCDSAVAKAVNIQIVSIAWVFWKPHETFSFLCIPQGSVTDHSCLWVLNIAWIYLLPTISMP